jgi:hypothetical protein
MSPAGPESEPDDWREPYARATAYRQRPSVYPKKRRLPAMLAELLGSTISCIISRSP